MPTATSETVGASYFFAAPLAHEGPLAIHADFDFGEDNSCVFRTVTSGTHLEEGVHMWDESGASGGAFYSGYGVHVHGTAAGQSVDTREVRPGGGLWSLEMTTTGPFSGELPYTLVGFNLGQWTRAYDGALMPPMVLDVQCEKPFSVSGFARSQEAMAWNDDHLRGGIGANVDQALVGASYLDGGVAEATFATENVFVRLSARVYTAGQGDVTMTMPHGVDTFHFDATADYATTGGPGTYRFDVDYLDVGMTGSLLGVTYGLEPVSSLEG